jgi:A/G-specific adenine glycosylase
MELGALICLPNGAPACGACPCGDFCAARDGRWRTLPVKAAKKPRRAEPLTVFFLRCGDRIAVRRRAEAGLLAGLWELPNVPGDLSPAAAVRQAEDWGVGPAELERETRLTHVFTHVEWTMRCYYLLCREASPRFRWVGDAALRADVALPTAFRNSCRRRTQMKTARQSDDWRAVFLHPRAI